MEPAPFPVGDGGEVGAPVLSSRGRVVANQPIVARDIGSFGQKRTLGVNDDVQESGGGVVVDARSVLILCVGDAGEVDDREGVGVGGVFRYGAVEERAVLSFARSVTRGKERGENQLGANIRVRRGLGVRI